MKKSKKIDLDKTSIMDYVPFEETPEFMEQREALLERLPTYQERFHQSVDLPEELMKEKKMGKYSVPIKMDMDKNIHLPDSDVSKYISKQQAKGKLFRKLSDVLSSPVVKGIGKAAKFAPLLGIASDVLASEDVGSGEQQELEQAKKEYFEKKKYESLSPEEKNIREKLKEKAMEPLTAEDMVMTNRKDPDKPIAPHRFEALTGTKREEPKEEHQIPRRIGPRSTRYMKLMRHMYGEK